MMKQNNQPSVAADQADQAADAHFSDQTDHFADQILTLRHDATLLMAEIRPLRARLRELELLHAGVASEMEQLSRRAATVKRLNYQGKTRAKRQSRQSNPNKLLAMFQNMTQDQQAAMMSQVAQAS